MILPDLLRFLKDNQTSIVTGVIGSLVAVLLQVLVTVTVNTLTYFLTLRMRLKRLFSFNTKAGEILVVSGSVEGLATAGVAFLAGPDASAALKVLRSLQDIFPKSSIKHLYSSIDQPSSAFSDDVVTIGGPVFNSCTKYMLDHSFSIVSFDESDRLVCDGHTYEMSAEAQVDFGLVYRFKNPAANDKKVIVIAGCGSHGVLAASMLFERARKSADLRKSFSKKRRLLDKVFNKDFVAIVKCRVSGNDISNVNVELVKTI